MSFKSVLVVAVKAEFGVSQFLMGGYYMYYLTSGKRFPDIHFVTYGQKKIALNCSYQQF